MKKSIFGKIGAAAVVLTLVTSSLVGGTFAKYVTDASGKATAKVAEWKVAFTNTESANFTKDIELKKDGSDVLLPGDSGTFVITIDGSQAEVGFDYSINITPAGEVGEEGTLIKFYSDEAHQTEITSTTKLGDTLESKAKADVTIYWVLPAGEGAEADKIDTAKAGKTADYTITMNATQNTPQGE